MFDILEQEGWHRIIAELFTRERAMHGTIGGPAYKPKPALSHDPRKAPIAVKGVTVKTSKTKGKGK